jgi:D-xylose 1-dehydrogenase (NADP+, D-xylono-1,5-lactone-forming)
MRLGLLSTANINHAILQGASEADGVEVVAVGSRDGARAQAYASEHGIPRAHATYEALLEDAEVDAVYISLPNGMHHEWAMKALAAGKHVLCEKPYSRHPAEVEEAFEAADSSGLVLMEAFMYRHHPQTKTIQQLVLDGAVGRILALRATFSFPLTDLTNVRAISELDGGALMDVGCYCVSGCRLVAGEPVSVLAEQVTGETGVDMALYGTMRFWDDVVAQFEASFLAPERQFFEVVGDQGVLRAFAPWRVDWGGELQLERSGAAPEVVSVEQANAYRLQLENMAEALAGRAPALLGLPDAVGQARAIDALYRSAEKGASVTV